MPNRVMYIGEVLAMTGFFLGVMGCGLLANNRLNAYVLMGFGCLFGAGLILVGVGKLVERSR